MLHDVTVLIYVAEIFRMSQILGWMYLGSVKSKKLVLFENKVSSLMIPCDMDRVTALHCGGCSNRNEFVLEIMKNFQQT